MDKKKQPKKIKMIKRCINDGCKRVAYKDGICRKCNSLKNKNSEKTSNQRVLESVIILKEIDKLRFLEIDRTLVNYNQKIKILQQEQKLDNQSYVIRQNDRNEKIKYFSNIIEIKSKEQEELLNRFGAEYNFKPKNISIDDKTGRVHFHKETSG